MTRLTKLPLFLMLALLALAPATAHAGEALKELKGAWHAQSFNGEAPPAGIKMVMTFVDHDTITMEVTFAGETEKEEIKYEATADGKMTVYPEETPEGESAKWEVKDGKLTITTDDGDKMVFKRP